MTGVEYQKAAMRTANSDDIALAALGLAGETGEAVELIKKFLYHGVDLDRSRLAEELGDILWYLALATECIGFSLDTIMERNIVKLRARYPSPLTLPSGS